MAALLWYAIPSWNLKIFYYELLYAKLYTRISDKVVGILLRARKYGLVGFEPEILYQRRDDEEPVILLKPMQEIYDIFNQHKSFAPQLSQSSNKES